MAVVTAPTALTETATKAAPNGPTAVEANLDVTNGNKFAWAPGKRLHVRNTTAGAIGVSFYADLHAGEAVLIDGSISANQVPANGVRVFGPFPSHFLNHETSISAANNGQIVLKQISGIAGALVAAVLPHAA